MAEGGDWSYLFERTVEGGPGTGERHAPGQGTFGDGKQEATVLAHRLGLPDPLIATVLGDKAPSDDRALFEVRNLLIQMGADFALNIAYYERETVKVQKQIKLSQVAAISVLLTLLAGLVYIVAPWRIEAAPASMEKSGAWVAQLSLVGTAVFAAMKALAVGTNYKARLTGFWAATQDLREALYTFEANWQNKLQTREALLGTDFHIALLEELRAARLIVRREREAYIEALASPNDIFSSASDVLSSVDTRIASVVTARKSVAEGKEALSTATAKDVAETRRKLIEAKSKLSSSEFGLSAAQEAGLADLDSYKKAIVDAKAEVELYSKQLRHKLKSDRLNPVG